MFVLTFTYLHCRISLPPSLLPLLPLAASHCKDLLERSTRVHHMQVQELFSNNGSHVLSFFLPICLPRSFPSPPSVLFFRAFSFSLSLSVLQFIRDRVCISTSPFFPHRRFREYRAGARPIEISGKVNVVFRDCQSRIMRSANRRGCSKQVLSRDLTSTLKRYATKRLCLTMYNQIAKLTCLFPRCSFQANSEA